jgi:hypothetical protein
MTIKDKRNKLEDQWKKCLQWDNDTTNSKKTTTNCTWHKGKKGQKTHIKTQKTHHNIGINKKINKKP